MSAIHHVTAFAGNAHRNLDFYTRVLGLRLVKKTVNFDDIGTYHFYFGDELGRPGTLMTFFPWENAAPGRAGAGQVEETSFLVPQSALEFWVQRLQEKAVPHVSINEQFGRKLVRFEDFDGTKMSLVAGEAGSGGYSGESEIPSEAAIRGIDSVTMTVLNPAPTEAVLTAVFGFEESGSEDGVVRFDSPVAEIGGTVLVRSAQEIFDGRFGKGSVHHVAFRAKDDAEQEGFARKLRKDFGIEPTPQKDRNYFRSIYFQEPGGVIYEIATDGPGFAADESPNALGTELKLPAHLESRRSEIEARLPVL